MRTVLFSIASTCTFLRLMYMCLIHILRSLSVSSIFCSAKWQFEHPRSSLECVCLWVCLFACFLFFVFFCSFFSLVFWGFFVFLFYYFFFGGGGPSIKYSDLPFGNSTLDNIGLGLLGPSSPSLAPTVSISVVQ